MQLKRLVRSLRNRCWHHKALSTQLSEICGQLRFEFKRIGASLRDATRTPSRRLGAQREAQRNAKFLKDVGNDKAFNPWYN